MKAAFYAILAGLLVIHTTYAEAQTSNGIAQGFASSPASVPPDALPVAGSFYVPVRGGTGAHFVDDRAGSGETAESAVEAGAGHFAFISQGRPVRLIGKHRSLAN